MIDLEEILQQAVDNAHLPHAIIAATNSSGSFTFHHSVGFSHLSSASSPQKEAITEEAELQLCSSTKLLTSIAVLQLLEKGKLASLDEDIADHLPELAGLPILTGFNDDNDEPTLKKRENPITVKHLLTHSSGTCYDSMHPLLLKYQAQKGKKPGAGERITTRYDFPLVYEPGSSWLYSPSLDWAALLVERVTGESLEDVMRECIFKPVGAEGSLTFWPARDEVLKGKIPSLTTRAEDGKGLQPYTAPFLNTGSKDCFGGHGLYGSMRDYLKVLKSILADDGKLLRSETVAMMFTPQLSPESKAALAKFRRSRWAGMMPGQHVPDIDADWGLGGLLFLESHEGRRKKGTLHWGGMANTFWIIDREADLALTFGTQVLPPGDPLVGEAIKQTELAMYERAGVKF